MTPTPHAPPVPSRVIDDDARAREGEVVLHMALERAPMSVQWARNTVTRRLENHELSALTGNAVQVVSELVTNAIQHGTGHTVTLTLREAGRTLHIDVAGPSEGRPALRYAPAAAEDGRGLWIVDHLATRWGSTPQDDGLHIWCTLVLPLRTAA
jgi:anti-sigma regulatory factor (Ser/Thr protein kinase)